MCYRTVKSKINPYSALSYYDSSGSPVSFLITYLLCFTLCSCPLFLCVADSIFLLCLRSILYTKAGTGLGNVCWQTLPAPPTDMYLFIEKNKTTALWPDGPGMPGCMSPFSNGLSFYHKLLPEYPDSTAYLTPCGSRYCRRWNCLHLYIL